MLRINRDGSIPPDNPFYNTATGSNRAIWALGLRNPFTFAFQPGTGRMFINDVGESTYEEINDGIAGSNYGWPITEGPTSNPAFRGPIYFYGHGAGCAIVGATFYNPPVPQFPSSYTGKYFFADLCSGWIRVFDPTAGTATGFATLTAGNYSAIVSGKNGGTGAAPAQVYDLDQAADSRLANISARAQIGTGSNVLIGGFITGNKIGATRVAVRALGPSLQQFGIANPLPDPRLELRNANGALLASNDNWQSDASQAALISSYGLAPPNNLESAIAISLAPGPYTAIVTGKNNQTGIGLIEIYDEQ